MIDLDTASTATGAVLDFQTLMTWDGIRAYLEDQILNNRLSQAAIIAGIIGAILTWGKQVPNQLLSLIKRVCTTTLRYNSDSPDYETISRFITQTVVKDTFSRNFVFQTERGFDREEWQEFTKYRGLTAGYGTHFGIFNGWPVLVDRSIEESNQTREFKEHTVITVLGRSKKRLLKMSNAISKAAGANDDSFTHVPVHINNGDYWRRMSRLPLRRMKSVFTKDDVGQEVVDTIRKFEASKEEHHRLGLPHHLGILLHGEPGCGKSSLIHAVATETERSIFYLNLGSVGSDKELTGLLSGNRDWSKIILAIEDIDAANVKVNRTEKSKKKDDDDDEKGPISLSALLNSLDGILCPDDLVLIATTNHHDRLDPALTREGRFDKTIKLGKLGYKDFLRMTNLFGVDPSKFSVANDDEMTGAAMRAMILKEA